jgi:hypothetical protein
VLVLLSHSSLTSLWQRHEIAMAFERADPGTDRRNIVPIFLQSPGSLLDVAPPEVRDMITRIQGFNFSAGEFEDNITRLKRWLRDFAWRS